VGKVDGTTEIFQPAVSRKSVDGVTNEVLSTVSVAAVANQGPARTLDSDPRAALGSKAVGLTIGCINNKENV